MYFNHNIETFHRNMSHIYEELLQNVYNEKKTCLSIENHLRKIIIYKLVLRPFTKDFLEFSAAMKIFRDFKSGRNTSIVSIKLKLG